MCMELRRRLELQFGYAHFGVLGIVVLLCYIVGEARRARRNGAGNVCTWPTGTNAGIDAGTNIGTKHYVRVLGGSTYDSAADQNCDDSRGAPCRVQLLPAPCKPSKVLVGTENPATLTCTHLSVMP